MCRNILLLQLKKELNSSVLIQTTAAAEITSQRQNKHNPRTILENVAHEASVFYFSLLLLLSSLLATQELVSSIFPFLPLLTPAVLCLKILWLLSICACIIILFGIVNQVSSQVAVIVMF